MQHSFFDVIILNPELEDQVATLVANALNIKNIKVRVFKTLQLNNFIEGAIVISQSKLDTQTILSCPIINQNNIAIFRLTDHKLALEKPGLIFKQKSSLQAAEDFHNSNFEEDFYECCDSNDDFFEFISIKVLEKDKTPKIAFSIKGKKQMAVDKNYTYS
tara:strand:+ start:715 stop:1194 length:480 start_codon:yes stop_codon:yes gene_type:complete